MKTAFIFIFVVHTTSHAALNKSDLRSLLAPDDFVSAKEKEAFKAKWKSLSKDDTFQWAEQVQTENIPFVLASIIGASIDKYVQFSNLLTEPEKARLTQLIIKGVEKHIAATKTYEALGSLYLLDNPLIDGLIQRLELLQNDERNTYFLNSLKLGLADTRSKRNGALKPETVQEPLLPVNPVITALPGSSSPAISANRTTTSPEPETGTISRSKWPWWLLLASCILAGLALLLRSKKTRS